MKKYIRYFIIGLLAVLGTTTVSAQHSGMWHFQYDMGVPLGSTSDFVSKFSPRGFAIEGQGYVSENISIGGRFAWDVYYQDIGWTMESTTITDKQGNTSTFDTHAYQKHYLNTMPLMVTGHYTFNSNWLIPYIGFGIGTYYVEQRKQVGIYIIDIDSWHFGLAPEVGIVIPFGQTSNWGLNLNVRYNWAAKTKNYDTYTWLNTSVGISYVW